MHMLSDPTLGLVVEIAANQFSVSEIKTVLMRADLWRFGEDKNGTNKQELVRSHLLAARDYAESHGATDARQALLNFIGMLLDHGSRDLFRTPEWFGDLREALLADGYEIGRINQWDNMVSTFDHQILPTDAGPVPLNPEISALEAELRGRSYDEALNHYWQALDAFARHDYEAANSQLRTALEDLVMRLAEDHTSYRQARAGDGGRAIARLTQEPALTADDGGTVLKGLWAMSHTKGSHPGRSDADETRFRLHAVTATARLLLHRFPARP
jgi:hypothetical protein